jgi:hypothetical protein
MVTPRPVYKQKIGVQIGKNIGSTKALNSSTHETEAYSHTTELRLGHPTEWSLLYL